jgi:hypothetical protein
MQLGLANLAHVSASIHDEAVRAKGSWFRKVENVGDTWKDLERLIEAAV